MKGLLVLLFASLLLAGVAQASYTVEDEEAPSVVAEDENDAEVDLEEDAEEGDDTEEEGEEDDEENGTQKNVPSAARRVVSAKAKEARLHKLYDALIVKYKALRSEIAKHVRAIMWRKFAFLRLVNARHEWSLLNKRYHHLVKRYKTLPKAHFLVRAYKRYTKTAEFAVRRSTHAYKHTARRTKKYLRNLGKWVKRQQARILALRARMHRYLKRNGRKLSKRRQANIRRIFRRRLAKERTRLAHIMQYWKTRIASGNIPAYHPHRKSRAQLLAHPRAKTPHPMVPFLHGGRKKHITVHRRHHKLGKWFVPMRDHERFLKHHKKHHKRSAEYRKWQRKLHASVASAWK